MPRNVPPSAMVGLDIGADSIKVAEARYGEDGITITAIGVARTPDGVIENEVIVDPKALGNAIKTLLAESGIKTKQVTSSVAGQSRVVVRVIEVPKMAREELVETMKWEVERQVPFPPNEVVMDFQPLERANADPNAQNMEVLLAVAQEQLITGHVETILAAGLKPFAIDIEPLAAGRALIDSSGNGSKDQMVAVVNLGATDTDLAIFEQGVLTFPSPPLSIAGASFTQEISEALGQTIEQAETLKKEYASVRLDGFASAPTGTVPPRQASVSEPTSFDTAVGPDVRVGSAFDLGDDQAQATPGGFRNTLDGPVFDSPDSAFGGAPASEDTPAAPAAPSFDLGDDDAVPAAAAAPAFDVEAAPPAEAAPEAPAGPVFDLDEGSPTESAPSPSFDLSDADAHAVPVGTVAHSVAPSGGGSVEDRVFEAMSGVLVDFTNELRRSIEYYSTRYSRMPERVYLCGGTAKMPHLDEFLSREIGLPVEVADPVKMVRVNAPGVSDRYLREVSPMLSIAIGLAIRDMVG